MAVAALQRRTAVGVTRTADTAMAIAWQQEQTPTGGRASHEPPPHSERFLETIRSGIVNTPTGLGQLAGAGLPLRDRPAFRSGQGTPNEGLTEGIPLA